MAPGKIQRVELVVLNEPKLAPVHVFPGEDEMLALAGGVLRVLRGKERPAHYG